MVATLEEPVAKKKEPKRYGISIRSTPEWLEWVEGLARRDRVSVAALIDQVLARYAKETGYEPEPPARGER